MNAITATNARSNWFQLVKKTVKGHLITQISSKEGDIILMSKNDYESLTETAELLSIKGLKESINKSNIEIKKGEVYSMDEVFKN